MRINSVEECHFYEIEAYKSGWSKDELGRQYGSSFFRMACKIAKLSGEHEFKELNSGGVFWVDFLTIGSMSYDRSIL